MKPFTFNRFLQAVTKAQKKLPQAIVEAPLDFIFVKTENRLEKVMFNEILYIEGMRDYRRIHLATKKIMTLQNFKELEQLIPSNIICRVHKSYMVALNKIAPITTDDSSTYLLIFGINEFSAETLEKSKRFLVNSRA